MTRARTAARSFFWMHGVAQSAAVGRKSAPRASDGPAPGPVGRVAVRCSNRTVFRFLRHPRPALFGVVAAFAATAIAGAQAPPDRVAPKPQLTSVIPAEAGLVVDVPCLKDLDAVSRRTGLYQLLPALAGRAAPLADASDLRRAVAGWTGVTQAPLLDRLMECEAAYVASSWSDLSGAVLIVRVKDEGWVNDWFPPHAREGARREDRTLTFESGPLQVAVRDRVIALTRKPSTGSWHARVIELMQSKKPSGWSDEQVYKKCLSSSAQTPVLVIGLNAPNVASSADGARSSPWSFEHLVACVRDTEGRLDVDVRARPSLTAASVSGSRVSEVFRRLPSTTLAAWATTWSTDSILHDWLSKGQASRPGQPFEMFSESQPLREAIEQVLPMLRDRVILVWGQPDPNRPHVPQVGLFIECPNAVEVARNLRDSLTSGVSAPSFVARPVGADDDASPPGGADESGAALTPGAEATPAPPLDATAAAVPFNVDIRHRYGIPLMTLRLDRPAVAPDNADSDANGFRPSFAAIDGWLIATLTDDYLVSLIEAHHGLRSTLGALPDVAGMQDRPARAGTLAVLQPALASGVLTNWLTAFQNGRPSPFDPSAWPGNERMIARLGVVAEATPTPGAVVVADVRPDALGNGRLQPGDRILGVDGQVLSVQETELDLRRRLVQSRRVHGPILRIERHGDLMDVEFPMPEFEAALSFERAMPMLRRLALVGSRVETACLSTWQGAGDEIAAHVSLRMSAPPSPRAAAPSPTPTPPPASATAP